MQCGYYIGIVACATTCANAQGMAGADTYSQGSTWNVLEQNRVNMADSLTHHLLKGRLVGLSVRASAAIPRAALVDPSLSTVLRNLKLIYVFVYTLSSVSGSFPKSARHYDAGICTTSALVLPSLAQLQVCYRASGRNRENALSMSKPSCTGYRTRNPNSVVAQDWCDFFPTRRDCKTLESVHASCHNLRTLLRVPLLLHKMQTHMTSQLEQDVDEGLDNDSRT